MRQASRLWSCALLALCLAFPATTALAQKDEKKPPPTRRTQVLGKAVYDQLEKAQQASDAEDYPKALQILNGIKRDWESLNDYEKAMLWNFYASVYYGMEDLDKTLMAYQNVLKQEQLPEGLRNAAMFATAQLYLVSEQYTKALAILDRWLQIVADPRPDAYILKAQALYQLERYAAAEEPIIQALRLAQQREQSPRESWLSLLMAVYYEQDKIAKAANVLEILVARFPKTAYYRQLAGMYGLLGRETDQLAVTRAAYEAGMLDSEAQIMNLARMYLAKEAPYPAIKVLRQGLKDKTLKEDKDVLQLYAQALSFGQEHEAQIPVLKKLANKTGESRHYIYLGQALSALARYAEAADAYRAALKDEKLERPGDTWINVGTALYNADKLEPARKAFREAMKFDKSRDNAQKWISFIGREIERKKALEL